jgi:hypothetical protein
MPPVHFAFIPGIVHTPVAGVSALQLKNDSPFPSTSANIAAGNDLFYGEK